MSVLSSVQWVVLLIAPPIIGLVVWLLEEFHDREPQKILHKKCAQCGCHLTIIEGPKDWEGYRKILSGGHLLKIWDLMDVCPEKWFCDDCHLKGAMR